MLFLVYCISSSRASKKAKIKRQPKLILLQFYITGNNSKRQTITAWVKSKLNESRNKMDMIQTQTGDRVKQATVQRTVM